MQHFGCSTRETQLIINLRTRMCNNLPAVPFSCIQVSHNILHLRSFKPAPNQHINILSFYMPHSTILVHKPILGTSAILKYLRIKPPYTFNLYTARISSSFAIFIGNFRIHHSTTLQRWTLHPNYIMILVYLIIHASEAVYSFPSLLFSRGKFFVFFTGATTSSSKAGSQWA